MKTKVFRPDHVLDYFYLEWFPLLLITVSGLIYNFGLLLGPWFEGKLADCLLRILWGTEGFGAMLKLCTGYVFSIAAVQIARYIKRFYVRRFANNVNRRMKKILYASLIRKSRAELEQEGVGNIMTKAISDVDDCVEGMRKFTTEIFDTGVAMVGYVGMLLVYDLRLALLCMIFPPISYYLAEHMKKTVQKAGAAFKEKADVLNAATLDRVQNAVTYRVYGCEAARAADYEEKLTAYEKAAVRSSIWAAAPQPVYNVISMASVLFILWFGARNVLHTGWKEWDIASFTTFLACFTKLSTKSSKAAKLFNSVHKAQVSWKRIKPFMEPEEICETAAAGDPAGLSVRGLSFSYRGGAKILSGVSFDAEPGQIIGITGPVAGGKSTLGKVFLCEYPYEGEILWGGRELGSFSEKERRGIVSYLGHDPEILSDSIRRNILMGTEDDCDRYLKLVRLDGEVKEMENGIDTPVGSSGTRLSGGQAQRLALARTLKHRGPLLILDDPFSALDRNTEQEIFRELKEETKNGIVLLISHRLCLFPELDKVIWIEKGTARTGTHTELMKDVPLYAELYCAQEGGADHEN